MTSNKKNDTTNDTEKEIRQSRKFSVADAIGRAGAGTLKGASPIPRSKQALMELETLLQNKLPDSEGSLRATLLVRLGLNLPLLDQHLDEPAGALRKMLNDILSSQSALQTLVRDTDARWGRDYQERPMFNKPGQEDHPDDPYTPASVRIAIEAMLELI